MKWILIFVCSIPLFASAQRTPLVIEGVAPDWYVSHTVAPKENYYSIGRLYNVSPKEIAPFNNLILEKGLALNQLIKVPLTNGNFTQVSDAAVDEALVPVYHAVKEKEGLYRIAANYNKLPLQTLKQWNNISGDGVSNGTKLIVGYLKVKKELSAFSSMGKMIPAAPAAVVKETPKQVVKEVAEVVKELPPAVKSVATENKPVVAVNQAVVDAPVKKSVPPPPVAVKDPAKSTPPYSGKGFGGGYFKNMYQQQNDDDDPGNEKGTAAVFKSNSGWEDGKYYCLHNSAAPGTIIKVTNPANGKAIFAKVLDAMPDIKQNSNVLIRLSNAAASELDAADKFDCSLSFSK